MKNNLIKFLLGILFLSLFACATTDNLGDLNKRFDEIKKIETLLFNQMPLPKDARISPDKSLILGEGDNWVGRFELSSSMEPLEASAFFITEYPKHGWQLILHEKKRHPKMPFFDFNLLRF